MKFILAIRKVLGVLTDALVRGRNLGLWTEKDGVKKK